MRIFRLLIGSLVVILGFGLGCSSSAPKAAPPKPGPKFTFTVVPDDSLANDQFQVALVLVNPSTRGEIENADVDDFFKPGSRISTLPLYVEPRYNVTSADHGPHKVMLNDKQRFPNYSDFVVIANFPYEIKPGEKDQRRILMPLDGNRWAPKTHEVTITLTRGGIRADPGPSQ